MRVGRVLVPVAYLGGRYRQGVGTAHDSFHQYGRNRIAEKEKGAILRFEMVNQ